MMITVYGSEGQGPNSHNNRYFSVQHYGVQLEPTSHISSYVTGVEAAEARNWRLKSILCQGSACVATLVRPITS